MQKFSKQGLAQTSAITLLLMVLHSSAAEAIDVGDRLEIHGYGHQGYLQSTGNTYLKADNKGTWNYNSLSLVFTAKIDDKSKIWAQLHGTSESVRLDWAYVDYQLTTNLSGRAGQIKQPLGLYNEIRDIKFLQLSTLEPMLYQEAAEIVGESFRGVSAIYDHQIGDANLSWDVYFGQPTETKVNETDHAKGKFTRLIGGRVTYKTSVEGLRFMTSAYKTKIENAVSPLDNGSKKTVVLSADYTANNFDIKAEYGKLWFLNEEGKTYYVQAGYSFAEKWTPFVRYDYFTNNVAEKNDPAHFQKAKVLGLDYKINDALRVRVENHFNRGYALPNASTVEGDAGGKEKWNLFVISINFIF